MAESPKKLEPTSIDLTPQAVLQVRIAVEASEKAQREQSLIVSAVIAMSGLNSGDYASTQLVGSSLLLTPKTELTALDGGKF